MAATDPRSGATSRTPAAQAAEVDAHLDAVLRASGSALRRYTTPKTLDAMRDAMRNAMSCAVSETATAIPSGIVKNMLAGQRLAVIDECALVCDGMSGIQFALIGKAATEEVKHKHGAKTAMAMECAAAIRSLKSAAPQVDAGYPGKGDYSQSGSEPAVSAPVTEKTERKA